MKNLLFIDPMVRAIQEDRKTVTRRIVTVPWQGARRAYPYEPYWVDDCDSPGKLLVCDEYGDYHPAEASLGPRYGEPGETIWVREAWACSPELMHQADRVNCSYRANYVASLESSVPGGRWRPSIHMPRWAARLFVRIVNVRIERLHLLDDEEAKREGAMQRVREWTLNGETFGASPAEAFKKGWDKLHDEDGARWADNPWVWRAEFRRTEAP
jgi:hypothetical protein